MLKLSKTQEKIVRQKNMGTFVITGEVHSGKTSVATLRMLHLLEHGCKTGERVLYVCANEKASKQVSNLFNEYYGLQNISLFDEQSKGEAIIKDVDALIEEAANKAHVHLNLELCDEIPAEMIETLLPQVRKAYPKVKWLKSESIKFIQHELSWMNTCGYTTFESYAVSARKGATMKLPKKGSGRKAMWLFKELATGNLKNQGFMTKDQVQVDTLCYLQEDALRERYKHIIIDDAHQLTKVQLECIKALKSEDQGEVLFLMDKKETPMSFAWLGSGNTFKTIGFNMTGRVKHLASKKKVHTYKKRMVSELTPLEVFMNELAQQQVKATESAKVSSLPWYVETYRYINKITGVETVFQRDSSAGETYIDEIKQDEIEELTIYSDIAAGMPIELVDEVSGKFELPSVFLHHKRNTYILHVQGDSMTGVNISDGDYVVIQAGNVNNHEIAAVYYNGATTLKRIVQEKERILLVSENPKYDPIVIEEGDFRVMGKLIGVIKPL
ncbi:MAG: AAA family ATPase [Cellulosilyticum sp.]|nr:AAA family ATPase [Cellulosilyticum sp.]